MKNLDMIMNLLSSKRPKKSQQVATILLGLATVAGISYIVSTFMESSKEEQPVTNEENTPAAEGDENDRKPARKVRVAHNDN
jgi:hypothetical protein